MAIQDVDDLIKQLRQHPEWRAALRREILTEELLSLPQLVRDLAAQVSDLAEAQRQTQAQVSKLVVEVGKLTAAQGRTDDRVGSLEGRLIEQDYYDKAYAYFDDILRKIRVLPWSEVADLLDQTEERITRKERKQVMEADLILRGRRLADREETYLLGEVSVGIGLEDVHRAAQRSKILARVTEMPVIPAVGGKSIIPEARELAQELGVSVFLDGGLQTD
jgi:cell division protein FtsB